MLLMEYGDFRSLYTEYPHYNSFGDPIEHFMNIVTDKSDSLELNHAY
jgi:hypothetical protein